MAIFGIGAYYGERGDVSQDFIRKGVACVGWTQAEAPSLHKLLRHIRIGDIIYIKTDVPSPGLTIKAIGVVTNDEIQMDEDLDASIPVKWVWKGHDKLGRLNDKLNVRNNTLYEEYFPQVQARVIDLLLSKLILIEGA